VRLIKNYIKAIKTSNDNYLIIGDNVEALLSFLLMSLILLMEGILLGEDLLKLASIGHELCVGCLLCNKISVISTRA
jgi:hypothetical protein